MSSLAYSFVKRSIHTAAGHHDAGDGQPHYKMPAWGVALLVVTGLVFFFVMFAIRYTYGAVVAALTIVESPQTEVYVQVDRHEDDPNAPKQPSAVEPDVLLVKPQPITAKIRTTIMHLRAKAGYWSRFRGLSVIICYAFVRGIIVQLFTASRFTRCIGGRFIGSVLADLILSRWLLTWVHIVISEPSPKKWFRRIPSWKSWKKIAPAVALRAVAEQLCILLPTILARSMGVMKMFENPAAAGQMKNADAVKMVWQLLLVLFVFLAPVLLIEIPAEVTFVRVAASMLPEEDESIVPFDRTFGGKVVPEILGGSGKVGMLEAWKSFGWAQRVRLLKLIGKVVAIQTAVAILFVMIYVGELKLIMGKELAKTVGAMHPHLQAMPAH